MGVFISCNKDEQTIDSQGTVKVKLTDFPFPFDFVTEANLGVAKVELKNAAGDYVVVFEGSSNYDMTGLTNGNTETVASVNIEDGTYNQARITLDAASVHLSNGTEFQMNSDLQESYTVTINPALVVEENDTSEVLFDLDINDSFEFQGAWMGDWIPNIANILGCNFNADFRVCDLDKTGEIEGTVSVSGTPLAHAYVTVEVDGEQIATQTEADGSFTLIGISEGTYTVSVESESDGSTSVSNIQVTADGTATCTLDL